MTLSSKILIERARFVDEELLDVVINLLPQLTRNDNPPTKEYLENVLASDNSFLLTARYPANESGLIVAMLTLIIIKIPSGKYAQIEDVVVDSKYRGKGIGRNLVESAILLARENHVKQVHLTSNPLRIKANKLYMKLGFIKRDTNVYFLDL
jgi:ribosomal protein S18 acetylase RimI-like enzyme